MKINLSKIVLSVGLLSISFYSEAQDLAKALPKDSKVIMGKLPNGLTYYIRPNGKPEKKVELRLAVNTGSIMEDDDQQGLAHFMEHMNFNGTKNFHKNELVSYLQSIGVQFGADLNAYTGFDETVYILPIPTDKEGNLDKGFQIIEDWAHNALLTSKDIDDERGVVLEESRMGKGANDRMMQQYLPKLMMGSKYAKRLPIGKDEILKNFKYDAIRRFYNEWYRPDLQAVAIAGDIDSATAMRYILKHFSGLKKPANVRERKSFDVAARTKPEAMVVTDKEATNFELNIVYPSVKSGAQITLGDYRRGLMEQLTQAMLNRRLSDLAKSNTPPFTFAQMSYGEDWARGFSSFSTSASFGEDGFEKALNALTAEMARAKQFGFNNSELELAKKSMMSSIERVYNERNNTESGRLVMELVRNFLSGESIPGIENEYEYYKQLLPNITTQELNQMVATWMSNSNIFVLLTGPVSKILPSNNDLLSMTQKGLAQKVEPLAEQKVASSLMNKMPVSGKVVSQSEDKELATTTFTLSNGIKVSVKKTDFKSDEILMKGIKKGGTNSYGVVDKSNAKYAVQTSATMGYGDYTPTETEKILAGKTAKVSMSMQGIENVISGNSNVNDLETMLQILYLKLTAPRTDEALFKAFVEKQKAQIKFLTMNPQVAFFDTTLSVLYKNNPLAPVPFPKAKDFEELNMQRALSIFKDEFGGADGYHFVFVGNVNQEQLIPLMEKYIGSLPVMNKKPDFKDNGVRPIPGLVNVKKGAEKQSLIIASYNGEIPYTESFKLGTEALAEVLNIKVIEEMREKLGSIYSGGYYGNVVKYPYPHYNLSMQLPCGPESVDKLLQAASEEIITLKEKGPDAKDLDKVKNQWKESYKTESKENGFWTEALVDIMFWGEDKNITLQYESMVDKLTTKDIQQVAKQIFNGKNEFMSILYPENFNNQKPRSAN